MSRFILSLLQGIHLAPWVQQWFGLRKAGRPPIPVGSTCCCTYLNRNMPNVRHRLRMSQQQVPELLNDCPVWGQVYFNKIFLHLWV